MVRIRIRHLLTPALAASFLLLACLAPPRPAHAQLGSEGTIRASYQNPLFITDSDPANADTWDQHDTEAIIDAMQATGQNTYFSVVKYHPELVSSAQQEWDEYLALVDAIATEGLSFQVVAVFKHRQGIDDYKTTACHMRRVNAAYPEVAVAWMVDDFQTDLCTGASLRGSCLGPQALAEIHDVSQGLDDTPCGNIADWDATIDTHGRSDFVAYISSNGLLDVGIEAMMLGGLSCYDRDGVQSDTWNRDCSGTEVTTSSEDESEDETATDPLTEADLLTEADYEMKPVDADYAELVYTLEEALAGNGLVLSFLHSDNQVHQYSSSYNDCRRDLVLAVEVDGQTVWYDFFIDGRDADELGEAERVEFAEIDLDPYLPFTASDVEVRFVVRPPDGGPNDYADGCSDSSGQPVTSWSKANGDWEKLAFLANVTFQLDDGNHAEVDAPMPHFSRPGFVAGDSNAAWRVDEAVDALAIVLDQSSERQSVAEYEAVIDAAVAGIDGETLVLPLMRGYFNGDFDRDVTYWRGVYEYALEEAGAMVTYRMPLDQYQQPALEGIFSERGAITTDSSGSAVYDYMLHRPRYVNSMAGWDWHQAYTFSVPCDGEWTFDSHHFGGTGNASHGQTWEVVREGAVELSATVPDASSGCATCTDSATLDLTAGEEVEVVLWVDEGRSSHPTLEFSWTPPAGCGSTMAGVFSSGFNDDAVALYEMISEVYLDSE